MDDTKQYPDGPYQITYPAGNVHAAMFLDGRMNGWGSEMFGLDALMSNGCTLTPLVPTTDLEAARQRIADLEAEVERLRAETWVPVADGQYRCQCGSGCSSLLRIASDADSNTMAVWSFEGDDSTLVELHGLRLCKRGAA